MRLRAGTWPWLLAHEMRIAWRSFGQRVGTWTLVLGGLLWLLFHIQAGYLMRWLSLATLESSGLALAGFLFWIVFTLMLSGAVVLSVNALFDRGDLDLLISSPLPTRTIFVVRGLGVALNSVALFALVFLPLVHMGIIEGQWGLLAAYPVLLGIALGIAGIAFAVTLFLVRWLGARRARVTAQVLSAVIGASVFLISQIPNLVSKDVRTSSTSALRAAVRSPWLDASSPLWWPVRALFGDPLPALATIVAGSVLFTVVIGATSRAFVSGTQESVTRPVRRRRQDKALRFRSGFARNIMRKEVRLILRDPNLIAKTLLQVLYLLPMFFVFARHAELALIVAPGVIFLLSPVAGNLAWITICGEEAPELVGSAPVDREKVRWLKAAAALQLASYLALPCILFYLVRMPWGALVLTPYLALALTASVVIQVWGGKPAPKRDLRMRQKQSVSLNLISMISTFALAGACYLTLVSSWWALAVLPLGLLAPGVAWTMRQADAV